MTSKLVLWIEASWFFSFRGDFVYRFSTGQSPLYSPKKTSRLHHSQSANRYKALMKDKAYCGCVNGDDYSGIPVGAYQTNRGVLDEKGRSMDRLSEFGTQPLTGSSY
jgi:hypothetical protein